ncbi:MAG: RNA polymerase Rpb4 family protein [Candidatus Methanofastidiosia archaeon]
MIGKKVLSERFVTLAEVHMLLSKRKKVKEMIYEQNIVLEHTKQFSKLKFKKSQDLLKELLSLGLREDLAVRLVDLMPVDGEEIKLLFSKERFVLDGDLVSQIAGAISKYRK